MSGSRETAPQAGDGGRLIVLTGASHTGKSSVARELRRLLVPPVALLSVDLTLETSLVEPVGDRWAEIPLAYELNRAQLAILLARGWQAIFESTFTYVPPTGEPRFHGAELDRVIDVARATGIPVSVIQLVSTLDIAVGRAARTARLEHRIVKETVELHRSAVLPAGTLKIDQPEWSPEQVARHVKAAIDAES